jgi:hypothetical protein
MGLFDGVFNTAPQQQAAQDQISGINAGLTGLTDQFKQGQGALSTNYAAGLVPFLHNYGAGAGGVTALNNALGVNGPAGNAAATAAFTNNPGYQFAKQQGIDAIDANAAKTGQLASGNTNLDIDKFTTGLAGQTYQNYVQNLMPYLGYSTSSAGGIGALDSGLGNQLNANMMGLGNATYGANASIGNANANAALAQTGANANILGAGMAGLGLGANLLGFLSDERAKDDIEPIGEAFDGQPIYRFRYKGDPRHQIGLIAQKVEEITPEAVDNSHVLKLVDYRRATDFAAELGKFLKEAA